MRNIVVYDLETTGKDPYKVFPIQFAAIPIDGASLKIREGDFFNQMCKPPNMEDMKNYKDNPGQKGRKLQHQKYGLWEFHAKHRGLKIDEIIALVDSAPPMDLVFEQFKTYVGQFKNKGKDPELAGFNIFNYDNNILYRLLEGKKGTWSPITYHDVMQMCNGWLRCAELKSISLDSLREYFGLKKGGHEALKDCKDTADILTRFLKYQQQLSVNKGYFAGAFKTQ